MATQLAGSFVPFIDFGTYHLNRYRSGEELSQDVIREEIWKSMINATPYKDVVPALQRLKFSGIKLAALTNGTKEIAASVFEKGGISSKDAIMLDVQETLAWVSYIYCIL